MRLRQPCVCIRSAINVLHGTQSFGHKLGNWASPTRTRDSHEGEGSCLALFVTDLRCRLPRPRQANKTFIAGDSLEEIRRSYSSSPYSRGSSRMRA